jgi:uncharacterized glyoxalase superfamily protein PhnB
MPKVKPIPEGFHSVTPSLVVKNAAKAMEFYKKAFGAEVVMQIAGPGNSVLHAEIKVGDSMIMLSDEWPGHFVQSPATMKGTTNTLNIYVQDVDKAHKQAVAACATRMASSSAASTRSPTSSIGSAAAIPSARA